MRPQLYLDAFREPRPVARPRRDLGEAERLQLAPAGHERPVRVRSAQHPVAVSRRRPRHPSCCHHGPRPTPQRHLETLCWCFVRKSRLVHHIGIGARQGTNVRSAGVVSTGGRNTCLETLCWCFVVKRLSGSFVELSGDSTQLCLTMYRQIGAFWKVLSQQAVGIFVCATLPGAVRVAEEDVYICG